MGATEGHLGQSALLHEVFNREDGDAPPVDLEAERRAGDFIRDNRQWIGACTDLSDGGLALAAFEMAVAGGVGPERRGQRHRDPLRRGPGPLPDFPPAFDKAEALMVAAGQAGVPLVTIGKVGGEMLRLGASETPMDELTALWRGAFATHFG